MSVFVDGTTPRSFWFELKAPHCTVVVVVAVVAYIAVVRHILMTSMKGVMYFPVIKLPRSEHSGLLHRIQGFVIVCWEWTRPSPF